MQKEEKGTHNAHAPTTHTHSTPSTPTHNAHNAHSTSKGPSVRVRQGDDLQQAFDEARPGTELVFEPGEWRQKAVIRTPGLRLRGAGAERSVIVYGDYAKKLDGEGREYNTFRTWTLAVCAPGVSMRGLSIVNDALRPEEKGQEVALSVVADDFFAEECTLRSTQDTLFCGPLPEDLIARYEGFLPDELRRGGVMRQRFERCRIEGTVDFIFGCGRALFERCEIRSLRDARGIGYAAAPAHAAEEPEGFCFRACAFSAEAGVADGSVYLARPWRDYGLARFENCSCGRHIAPAGFDPWNDSGRDRSARFYETPPVPGRVKWIHTDS